MIKLFMKCLVFLQSQEAVLLKKKKLEHSINLSISRSILIASYIIYLKKSNDLDKELKIDIQRETHTLLNNIIKSPNLDQ